MDREVDEADRVTVNQTIRQASRHIVNQIDNKQMRQALCQLDTQSPASHQMNHTAFRQ